MKSLFLRNKLGLFSGSLVLALALDQGTKCWVSQSDWPVQLNTGISFGILAGLGAETLGLMSAVLLGAIAWWGMKQTALVALLSGLFVGAGISNLIDRVVFGGVRDWLALPFVAIRNNIADWIIALVVIGFVVYELVFSIRGNRTRKDLNAES